MATTTTTVAAAFWPSVSELVPRATKDAPRATTSWAPTSGRIPVRATPAAVPTAATVRTEPSSTRNPPEDSDPSQPADSAPTTSSARNPRSSAPKDSAPAGRPRRAIQPVATPAPAVSVSRIAVRPPMVSSDHATTRNTIAATNRQVAPSPSRMRGTEAALNPPRGAAGAGVGKPGYAGSSRGPEGATDPAGAVTGPAPTPAGTGVTVSWATSVSAWARVRNSPWATGPVSAARQCGHCWAAYGIDWRQQGQTSGSA